MKKINSYEDALNALKKERPTYLDEMPKNEQGYHKLCTICEALNMGHEMKDRIWFPWWLSGDLQAGVAARFSPYDLEPANSDIGFRLCSFDRDTALYFGSEPFVKLWQEYLL